MVGVVRRGAMRSWDGGLIVGGEMQKRFFLSCPSVARTFYFSRMCNEKGAGMIFKLDVFVQ